MVLLNSEFKTLGHSASDFNLPGVDGRNYALASFKDKKILVILFICNHCPYVKAIEDRIIQIQKDYSVKSVQLIGICSNDATGYPDDSFDNLKKRWQEKNYGFPYLVDESQGVARSYGAVCTPDIFVYDQARHLAYHGQIDNNWKDPDKVTKHDLREALDLLLAGKNPDQKQIPSMGCSIKWKT